jgi:hypothetical protein
MYERRNITLYHPCNIYFPNTYPTEVAESQLAGVMKTETTLVQFLEQEVIRRKERFPAKQNPVCVQVLLLIQAFFKIRTAN